MKVKKLTPLYVLINLVLMGCSSTEPTTTALLTQANVEEKLTKAGMNCCELKLAAQINSNELAILADSFLQQVKADASIKSTACKHAHTGDNKFGTLLALKNSSGQFEIYFKPMHIDALISAGVCEDVF